MSERTVSNRPSAAIVAVEGENRRSGDLAHDRFAGRRPLGARSARILFGIGPAQWVSEQTRYELGYTEQLYTFGDKDATPPHRVQAMMWFR